MITHPEPIVLDPRQESAIQDFSSDYREILYDGGTRCFHPCQKIVCENGPIEISKIKKGDKVKSYNSNTKKNEFRTVLKTYSFKNNKKTVKIKLKNGNDIICTEDHEFFYKGGWQTAKHLLSLLDERKLEHNK